MKLSADFKFTLDHSFRLRETFCLKTKEYVISNYHDKPFNKNNFEHKGDHILPSTSPALKTFGGPNELLMTVLSGYFIASFIVKTGFSWFL